MTRDHLLIVGNDGGTHVGASFARAARALGLPVDLVRTDAAYGGNRVLRSLAWRVLRKPLHLARFSRSVVAIAERIKPKWIVTTGVAPLREAQLKSLRLLGARRLHFATDDPWSPTVRATWYIRSLSEYDAVFTPRRSNISDLAQVTGASIKFLPFAYDSELWSSLADDAVQAQACDVLFVGGGDADRARFLQPLLDSARDFHLYGAYWDRWTMPERCKGLADPAVIGQATLRAKVNLCLVRRSNRDGHVMRSFEIPAIGGCILAERTPDHLEILGPEGECTLYFTSPGEMLGKIDLLLRNEPLRRRLAQAAHRRIRDGRNTYRDRLSAMLNEQSSS